MSDNYLDYPPIDGMPRHRLMERYNWFVFKQLARIAGLMLLVLAVLVAVAWAIG